MKIPYFCCIGAELKRYEKDFDFMNQVYLYKVPTDDSIDEVLAQDYFKAISDSVLQDDIVYIYEASAEILHECRFNKQDGHITAVPLASDETLTGAVTTIIHDNLTPNKFLKSDENGKVAASDFSENDFVKVDGSSIMTGPLKFRAGSMRGAVAPYLNGVSFWKMDSQGNITNIANLTDSQFSPVTTNSIDLGNTTHTWKDAHVARIITGIINNGYDIAVPVTNSADTLALKSEVDNAANSGDQLYATGVWYAKMYAASVVPTGAEYDGKNYADFSQTDSGGNPVIKIYTGASGAWTLTETITPPADYNGYMTITSKIWDIAEQAGQQGGKVLWSHNQRTFTPYPQIISFENAALTGTPTAPTLTASSPSDQIVNKQTLENALVDHGTGRNVGDIFFTMRNDNELNGAVECDGATYNTTDFTGAESIGALLEAGKLDYISLTAYADAITQKGWCDKIGWDGIGNTQFRVPTLNAHIVQTNNIPVVGNGMTMGMTNGTTNYGLQVGNHTHGEFHEWQMTIASTKYGSAVGTSFESNSAGLEQTIGITTDGTKSGIIADTSDTAQLRVMIQIANSATDEALETCTNVLADVAELKYDYVVDFQAPTAQNNYTWYRKYKSGWVEQGGVYDNGSPVQTKSANITLPIAMADTNYTVIETPSRGTVVNTSTSMMTGTHSKTTTGFSITWLGANTSDTVQYASWQVSGMAAN